MLQWLRLTIVGYKVRIVPKQKGKKGIDWTQFYAVQFNDFLGWWTVKEFETMKGAQNWVENSGPFNKHNSVQYTYMK